MLSVVPGLVHTPVQYRRCLPLNCPSTRSSMLSQLPLANCQVPHSSLVMMTSLHRPSRPLVPLSPCLRFHLHLHLLHLPSRLPRNSLSSPLCPNPPALGNPTPHIPPVSPVSSVSPVSHISPASQITRVTASPRHPPCPSRPSSTRHSSSSGLSPRRALRRRAKGMRGCYARMDGMCK